MENLLILNWVKLIAIKAFIRGGGGKNTIGN